MEQQIEAFFHYILVDIPMACVPYLMAFYVSLMEYSKKGWAQTKLTCMAVKSSFEDTYIRFFETEANSVVTYIPIVTGQQNPYNYQSKWIYSLHDKTFVLCEISHDATTHRLPFIGASLEMCENGRTDVVGDMSEWLMEQSIFAPSAAIPLQILAAAWLYGSADPTLVFTYKNMRMRVITEDGDEKLFALEDEREIEEGEIVGEKTD